VKKGGVGVFLVYRGSETSVKTSYTLGILWSGAMIKSLKSEKIFSARNPPPASGAVENDGWSSFATQSSLSNKAYHYKVDGWVTIEVDIRTFGKL
jgi:hypothetical protein